MKENIAVIDPNAPSEIVSELARVTHQRFQSAQEANDYLATLSNPAESIGIVYATETLSDASGIDFLIKAVELFKDSDAELVIVGNQTAEAVRGIAKRRGISRWASSVADLQSIPAVVAAASAVSAAASTTTQTAPPSDIQNLVGQDKPLVDTADNLVTYSQNTVEHEPVQSSQPISGGMLLDAVLREGEEEDSLDQIEDLDLTIQDRTLDLDNITDTALISDDQPISNTTIMESASSISMSDAAEDIATGALTDTAVSENLESYVVSDATELQDVLGEIPNVEELIEDPTGMDLDKLASNAENDLLKQGAAAAAVATGVAAAGNELLTSDKPQNTQIVDEITELETHDLALDEVDILSDEIVETHAETVKPAPVIDDEVLLEDIELDILEETTSTIEQPTTSPAEEAEIELEISDAEADMLKDFEDLMGDELDLDDVEPITPAVEDSEPSIAATAIAAATATAATANIQAQNTESKDDGGYGDVSALVAQLEDKPEGSLPVSSEALEQLIETKVQEAMLEQGTVMLMAGKDMTHNLVHDYIAKLESRIAELEAKLNR